MREMSKNLEQAEMNQKELQKPKLLSKNSIENAQLRINSSGQTTKLYVERHKQVDLSQHYEKMHSEFRLNGITLQSQHFLYKLSLNAKAPQSMKQSDLFQHLKQIQSHLMLNEIEIVYWAIFLDKFGWEDDTFQIIQFLYFTAFAVKQFSTHDITMYSAQLNKDIKGFIFLFNKWISKYQHVDCEVVPTQLNEKFKKLSEKHYEQEASFKDFNSAVDQILEYSGPMTNQTLGQINFESNQKQKGQDQKQTGQFQREALQQKDPIPHQGNMAVTTRSLAQQSRKILITNNQQLNNLRAQDALEKIINDPDVRAIIKAKHNNGNIFITQQGNQIQYIQNKDQMQSNQIQREQPVFKRLDAVLQNTLPEQDFQALIQAEQQVMPQNQIINKQGQWVYEQPYQVQIQQMQQNPQYQENYQPQQFYKNLMQQEQINAQQIYQQIPQQQYPRMTYQQSKETWQSNPSNLTEQEEFIFGHDDIPNLQIPELNNNISLLSNFSLDIQVPMPTVKKIESMLQELEDQDDEKCNESENNEQKKLKPQKYGIFSNPIMNDLQNEEFEERKNNQLIMQSF